MSKTLLELLGAPSKPTALSESALIIVDAQREYVEGKLPLDGVQAAIGNIKKVLDRSRSAGAPIFFIRHSAGDGAPVFNPQTPLFQIVDELKTQAQDIIIDKHYPSSFAHTTLHEQLQKAGLKSLIVTGFMTHACISTTVRQGAELGYACTVISDACGTRDLPSADGNVVKARVVHDATLAALKDLFACVVPSAEDIAD